MKFIETHAHIYSKKFSEDAEEVVKRSFEAGIDKIFMPNIDLESIEGMLALEQKFPGVCYPMLGLHPCDVDKDFEKTLFEMEKWWDKHTFYGVGETGIDLHWDKTHLEEQKASLKVHVKWAKEKQLPLILHCRESLNETLEFLAPLNDKNLTGIFHCFSGTVEQAKEIIDLGFYLGIGGTLTYKNSGVGAVLEELGPEHLVLETDSPFLAPVPFRGKRNSPEYIPYIAEKMAEFTGISISEVSKITNRNALKVFKLLPNEL
ncbi:TatD family hydrolase [Cyclobacterium qasimii]|uniref:TatD family hydrolase n=2 Tax=Cyclobacterium qasimii TaxID=1350429 RepID=A0A512C9N0_9BACT|nr:TatD family hydrolase [Cyclobacterium qasimii]EPR65006.1 putative deoxyribonuclease YcfH [Cyclobacterium qasimii M12-11B]GEO20880.1 TatD family hydrolase [Cyclobacterium qasimii]